jgi:hypothetical protein
LVAIPYGQAYRSDLERAAQLLQQAATLTENSSLQRFLNARAEALLSNRYRGSDLAWLDLDAPLDIMLGPYETYIDELFGKKAAFEAYVGLRDARETARLTSLLAHLQEIEDHLPEDPHYRNVPIGPVTPIRIVDEVFASGDADHGVLSAAYNLPNDETVLQERGSKRILLKNVEEAKFRAVLLPVAIRMLAKDAQLDVSFDMFFLHIMMHELMHGLGPHQVTVEGRTTTVRAELREAYGAIEEVKADAAALFAFQYLMDNASTMNLGSSVPADETALRQLYLTYIASVLRALRFGLSDAHGKGMAVAFNYLCDRAAIIEQPEGVFNVDVSKMRVAVRELTHELLTLEGAGDYAGARRMLDSLGVIRPELARRLRELEGIPVDVEPVYATADELMSPPPKATHPNRTRSARANGR